VDADDDNDIAGVGSKVANANAVAATNNSSAVEQE